MDVVLYFDDIKPVGIIEFTGFFSKKSDKHTFLKDPTAQEFNRTLECNPHVERVFILLTPRFLQEQELLNAISLAVDDHGKKPYGFAAHPKLKDRSYKKDLPNTLRNYDPFPYERSTHARMRNYVLKLPIGPQDFRSNPLF